MSLKRTLVICCMAVGLAVAAYFAYYRIFPRHYELKRGQSQETMVASAQGALDHLIDGSRMEALVDVNVTSVKESGNIWEVSIIEKRKTQPKDRKQAAASIALECAGRIAKIAPEGTTVKAVLVDEAGEFLNSELKGGRAKAAAGP